MSLETATYIASLVTSNPDGGDARSTADDHLRLIKAALKRSFPQIDGAVSASAQAISYVNDLSASAQAQLNALRDGTNTAIAALNARYANSASVAAYVGNIAAAAVASVNLGNVFTESQAIRVGGNASLEWRDTTQLADSRAWLWITIGTNFELRAYNDALAVSNPAISVQRTGQTIDALNLYGATVAANGSPILTEASAVDADLLGGAAAAAYARLDTAQSFAKGQAITQASSSGTSLTPNCDDSTMFRHVLTGATTIGTPANARSGMVISFHLIQGGAGSNTVTWAGEFAFAGGSAPTLSTSLSAVDVLAFQYDSIDGLWRQGGLGVA